MNFYLLFSGKEVKKCSQIFSFENGSVFSYCMDEDIIVKNEEPSFISLEDLKNRFAQKTLKTKALEEKDFVSANAALRYLNSSQSDFKEGVPHFKCLLEIVNPYDMDFGLDDAYDEDDEDSFPGMDDERSSDKKSGKKREKESEELLNDPFSLDEDIDLFGDISGALDDDDNY